MESDPNGPDDLTAELRELYAAERADAPTMDAVARAHILARVAAAPAAATGFSLGALVVASVVSAALGAGAALGVVALREARAPKVTAPALHAPPAAAPVVDAASADATSVDASPAPVPPSDAPVARPHPSRGRVDAAPRSGEPAGDEGNLIDRARVALARDEPHAALVALMAHERRFADGALREEREYLAIVALAAEGKRDQAVARAAAYRQRYPRGSYIGELDRLLGP